MLFPTGRQQNRYPMPPSRNQPHFGAPPNRLYRNAPSQRSGAPTGGMNKLLGRLLGSGGQMTNVASQGGGGGITKSLANIQQILNVVQSTAPMIQEYGPMVKNLPAMYRMMKAFKDLEKMPDENEVKRDNMTEIEDSDKDIKDTKEIKIDSHEEKKNDRMIEKKQVQSGKSTPKLYI